MERYSTEDNYSNPTKIQNEANSEMQNLRKKQAVELTERRKKYNQEVEQARKVHLKERSEKQNSYNRKLQESRNSVKRDQAKSFLQRKRESLKNVAKDQLNTRSQYRGMGRALQYTGTAKLANKFINYANGSSGSNYSNVDEETNYSCLETISKDNILRDELIVKGFLKEVKIVQDVLSRKQRKDKSYFKALGKIEDYLESRKKKHKKGEKSSDSQYSHSWNLLCKFCTD